MSTVEEEAADSLQARPWLDRLLLETGSMVGWAAAALIAGGLLAGWRLCLLVGGTSIVPPHWFYIPILFAGVRFGLVAAMVAGAASGVLAGPLAPAVVATNTPALTSDWTARAAFFVLIGSFCALLTTRLRVSLSRETVMVWQEMELAHQQAELARQQSDLIRNVSHEFRTPLTVIAGGVQTLLRHLLVPDRGTQLLASMERASQRLGQLVEVAATLQSVQDTSTRRSLPMAALELDQLCSSVAAALSGFNSDERLRARISEDAQVIRSHRQFLSTALRCLIENALKFSPPSAPVDVWATRRGEEVEIHVVDRGIGLPESFATHLIRPFAQWDASETRAHGGLGLGLFVAKSAVEELGGRLDIAGPPGVGTDIVVYLPQRRSSDTGAGRTEGAGGGGAFTERQASAPEPAATNPPWCPRTAGEATSSGEGVHRSLNLAPRHERPRAYPEG